MCVLLITNCKLVILAVYWRIFNIRKSARWAMMFDVVAIICPNLGVLFTAIFICRPIERSWDLSVNGECGSPALAAYTSGVSNVVEDLFLLLLPLSYLSEMNMWINWKLRVMAVFGLGILRENTESCIGCFARSILIDDSGLVASIIRLINTQIILTSLDLTRNMSNIAIWLCVKIFYFKYINLANTYHWRHRSEHIYYLHMPYGPPRIS